MKMVSGSGHKLTDTAEFWIGFAVGFISLFISVLIFAIIIQGAVL